MNASSLVSGSVTSDSGRALAHISVTLTVGDQSLSQLTDAFGRYQFASVAGGTYQLDFTDVNFIDFVDEDPYPDAGTVYSNAVFPRPIVVQENQSLGLGNFVLSRVDSDDDRQSNATVSDCTTFGDGQGLQTFSYALLTAKEITVECTGTLPVPELTISRDVKIAAPVGLALEAAGSNRLIRVLPGVDLQVSGVDLTNGEFTNGVAIYNLGIATIENAEITGNRGSSATILNHGRLNLRNVRQYRNIVNYDSVLTNTGVVTGTDVVIEDHVSSGGPVIGNGNGGRIELTRCDISGLGTNNVWSVANGAGATIKLFGCTFSQSSSPFSNEGTLEIYDSSISNNSGDQSLIENSGVLKIGGTSIIDNDVYGVMVENSGLADVINSTVSGNNSGFGLSNPDYAGAISNRGLMRVTTSTIANNTHPGAGNYQIGNSGELTVSNSIVSGVDSARECSGMTPVQSLGHNLHTDGTCGSPQQTDIPYGNPGLLELADNGGPGKTHALQSGSDAIDTGNCGDGALSKDQRGIARPQGNGCDIGAFELVAAGSDSINDTEGGAENDNDSDVEDADGTENSMDDTGNSMDDTGNSTDGAENSADDSENSTDTTNTTGTTGNSSNGSGSSTDAASETTDSNQTGTPINISESIIPATDEPQRSGGGSIVIPWWLLVAFSFAGADCRRRTCR